MLIFRNRYPSVLPQRLIQKALGGPGNVHLRVLLKVLQEVDSSGCPEGPGSIEKDCLDRIYAEVTFNIINTNSTNRSLLMMLILLGSWK